MAAIRVRKTASGTIRYHVQVRIKGHPAQTASFERKTDARKWAQQIEAAIREGRHFKTAEAKRHTLAELIDRYIGSELPKKGGQKYNQQSQLEWWKGQIGDYLLANITPALIADCRDRLAKDSTHQGNRRAPATVNRYLAALSHAFSVAINEWGWVNESPMRKVKKLKEPRGRVRFLSDDEVRSDGSAVEGERTRLLKACEDSSNPYLYSVVVLALSTGMRQGEIMNLKWNDVDLKQGRITLHHTKNRERRVVPLTGHALETIKVHSRVRRIDSDLLFPGLNPHKPMDLREPWLQALRKAGINDFRFHDLRHSAASYLAMNGASLADIAEVLGHKTLQMVKRYSHLSEQHTAGVVARMNARIFAS